MKNFSKLLLAAAMIFTAIPASRCLNLADLYMFNHLGVSVHAATTGFGFEVATPMTKFVTLRAGASFMPGIKFSPDLTCYYTATGPDNQKYETEVDMDIDASLKRTQGSVIFNIYPFAHSSSFFVAAGAYFGGSSIIGLTGHSNQLAGQRDAFLEIGDYKLPIDANGNVNGSLRAKSFRPYLGLGFGRPLPKGRLNFGVELGVQFMGKTKIYSGDSELIPTIFNDDDDWHKWMDKVTVYPVLKFTLSGRIF